MFGDHIKNEKLIGKVPITPMVKRWFCKCGKTRMLSVMDDGFPRKEYLKEERVFKKAECKSDIIRLEDAQSDQEWCFDCKI